MGHAGTTAQHQLTGTGVPGQRGRRGMMGVALRAVLILGWTVLLLNGLTQAREASVDDLGRDLAAGSVSAIEVQRPAPGDEVQGSFGLRWDGGVFDSFTRYDYRFRAGVDEAAPLLEQARADGVAVHVVPVGEYGRGEVVTASGWLVRTLGPWVAGVGALVFLAGWLMLASSPQLWLASKWAWFWLLWLLPPLWPVFLLLEPRPLGMSLRLARAGRTPQPLPGLGRRLTGGWALVIGWSIAALLGATGIPLLTGWY